MFRKLIDKIRDNFGQNESAAGGSSESKRFRRDESFDEVVPATMIR